MKKLLTVLTATLLITACASSVDEPTYSLVRQDGDVEIRSYEPTAVAATTVNGQRDEAIDEGFRRLFKYIGGENSGAKEIPMTAPVAQTPSNSQKIPMTAPVAQQALGENEWKVVFYMPNDMAYDALPTPKSDQVKLEEVAAHKKAVIRFSGFLNNENIMENEKILRDYLTKNAIKFEEPAYYAGYDAPWTLWFLRRNEIMFKLK